MRVAIALGGNALLERGEKPDANIQESHVTSAIQALAPLARRHQLVITYGNGRRSASLPWSRRGTRPCRSRTRLTSWAHRPRA